MDAKLFISGLMFLKDQYPHKENPSFDEADASMQISKMTPLEIAKALKRFSNKDLAEAIAEAFPADMESEFVCPVCGASIDTEDEEADYNGNHTAHWKCEACNSSGTATFTEVFVGHEIEHNGKEANT